jgi:hypothetical protein
MDLERLYTTFLISETVYLVVKILWLLLTLNQVPFRAPELRHGILDQLQNYQSETRDFKPLALRDR